MRESSLPRTDQPLLLDEELLLPPVEVPPPETEDDPLDPPVVPPVGGQPPVGCPEDDPPHPPKQVSGEIAQSESAAAVKMTTRSHMFQPLPYARMDSTGLRGRPEMTPESYIQSAKLQELMQQFYRLA
jgi:hypothetical protein